MIKKILFISLFFLFSAALYCQSDFKPYWNIGVGFGPTFSSVDFVESNSGPSSAVTTKMYSQMHGGLAVRYMTEKHLGFIVELNYAQQGWEQEFKGSLADKGFAHSHSLNYFEMPFLTHIYWGNKFRFIINLGPKISYMLSEKEEINQTLVDYLASGGASSDMVTAQYFRDADRKFDYGIMGGLGMEYQSKYGNFSLEGRYYFGLGDVYKNSKADAFSRSSNQVISVRLTYYVKLF
ncbi:porin family protein [Dysgonomonas sp. 25]|uniref:porin family protein n=1 Tax=Dysgonomonas sp. 25 TaxID=2302933 RepID=UPI0013D62088|nr:porin family protein [Dysgonomonas sp. 25]NDV70230.1 PorT family protein [Dysgonomonas sp. 25]